MHLIFNIFSTILLLSGLVSLLTALFIFKRMGGAATWFGLMMLTIVIWSLCYGFELASIDLQEILFWSNLKYIGICLLSPIGAIFIIHYIGKEVWLTKRNLILIFFLPVLTLI